MDSTYFTHSFPEFPILDELATGGGVQIEIFQPSNRLFSLSCGTHDRGGGRGCVDVLPCLNKLTPGERFWLFHGLHTFSFMDSTISHSWTPHILFLNSTFCLWTMSWTPQILCFNYTFGFMDSTKVLVSTLKIRPGLGPNGQAADIATELS